jgi:hypothetical protein
MEAVRREVEVDTALASLHGRLAKVHLELDANKLSLAYALGIRPTYVTRTRREIKETAAELAEKLASDLADGKLRAWDERNAREMLARRESLSVESAAILREMEPLNAEFAAKPWSRFFLVTSSAGGHIHSSMNCSTCRIRTRFGWLPELSGLTEKDAVEAHGPLLCSVCYPSAPVEWTMGLPKDESDKCPGSGEYVANPNRRRYLACPTCAEHVSITSTGKLRAHKSKAVA